MDFEFYFNDKCSEQENDIKWFIIVKNALELGRREEKCQQRTSSDSDTEAPGRWGQLGARLAAVGVMSSVFFFWSFLFVSALLDVLKV